MQPNNPTPARPIEKTRIHGLPYSVFEQAFDMELRRRREADEVQQAAQKARVKGREVMPLKNL